jgi:A-macroglobulin TED domain/Alpha-2-macroglobulin family/MG2 domain/Carboxypeptidase regulatory-like domain/A-macroglobulin receptor binding domain/Macroglobulin domain MG3
MRSKLFLLLVVLFVCLAARAQTVNENGVQFVMSENGAKVILPVEARNEMPATNIHVELLDIAGNSQASADATGTIVKGASFVEVPIDLANVITREDFGFYRLRYQVGEKSGTLSLARAAADIFDLEAFSFDYLQENSRYLVRIRAIHPVRLKGVGGVKLHGKLDLDLDRDEKKAVEIDTVTDAEGFAVLVFQLPAGRKIDDLEVAIEGENKGFQREIEKHLSEYAFRSYSYLYFQTDKPIYQPGQMLRARTLFFNDKKKAITDDPLTFTIKDEDGTIMSKTDVKTSRFGVASLEWQIPDNVKPGTYSIVVSSDRELNRDKKEFKISRYDLPNFAVSAGADRKYYVPDQKSASIEVKADYLFGKPVTNAKVRVVEETERNWNSKLRTYETKEGQVKEGMLDANGKFTADFDLTQAHDRFEGTYYINFKDINFAAYVTDLATNKTEQKRFDVRITRRPIHLYFVSRTGDNDGLSRRMSPRFYLTATYADGAPAECDFNIYRRIDGGDEDDPKTGKMLAKGKTDRLGASRVTLPPDVLGEEDDDLELVIKARDRSGNKGLETSEIDFDDTPAVFVSTDKIAYRKGDPINVSVEASERESQLFLSVMRNSEVLVNEKIRLHEGRATISVPSSGAFSGPVTIAAYGSFRDEDGDARSFSANRTVLFPAPAGLTLSARSSKDTYHPGEEASIELSALKPGGETEESVFGVSVLDKAIDERARTDAEFGGRYETFYSEFSELLTSSSGNPNDPDNLKTLSPEEELAMEIALRRNFSPDLEDSGNFREELTESYEHVFVEQFMKLDGSLKKRYLADGSAAVDDASLRSILMLDEIELDKMVDPWGNGFRASIEKTRDKTIVHVVSSGPDEIYGTADDITAYKKDFAYFAKVWRVLNRAFASYEQSTEDFIHNYKTLWEEVKKQGLDLDALKDLWGKPYRFEFGIQGSEYFLKIQSGGSDRKFGKYDDFTIWTHYADYFSVARAGMAAAVRKSVAANQQFPADETELKKVLKASGFDLDVMKDVYGRPYYITREMRSRFADRTTIGNANKTQVRPVSQDVVIYTIKSTGMDGVRNAADDFELTRFIGIVSEQNSKGETDKRAKSVASTSLSLGGLIGVVSDPNGAVIANAVVKARYLNDRRTFETRSDAAGEFIFSDLPPGLYEVSFESPGFRRLLVQNAYVDPSNMLEISATLEVAGASTTVDVVGAPEIDQSSSTGSSRISTDYFSNIPTSRTVQGLYAIAPTVARSGLRDASGRDRDPSVAGSSGPENNYILDGVKAAKAQRAAKTAEEIATPRLREYFPETLVWFPELISGIDGKASFKFKLADSLTTWKVAVVGSTANGDIAIAEKEIKTFQPFFVDLDPPKFLTNGDEILLPVQVRNYTEKKQTVDVTMAKADWFGFLGSGSSRVDIEASNSENAIFGFKATAAVKDGKQRVTAIARDDSDAIEKPVTVRPDGDEIVKTTSRFFSGSTAFDINFPANALAKTQKAELKIYPNLFSHVGESVEGLLQRPHGCGEQTISSTYPNLMILKFSKDESNLRRTAQKYLQKGVERLAGYQVEGGGFSYWGGKDQPDLALTAYALRFLNDAKEFIAIDDETIKRAQDWLVKQQREDGSFFNKRYSYQAEDQRQTKLFTAYVARSLAMSKGRDETAPAKALAYLKAKNAEIDEPYSLALYGLAALDSGDAATARLISIKLQQMAIQEGDAIYWNLETNTPFYGWGTAGRLETTALVLQLLIRDAAAREEKNTTRDIQIGMATLFLLKNKDRYGVWYSTQTTINVLDAFLAALIPLRFGVTETVTVSVNGKDLPGIAVRADQLMPIVMDLAGDLDPASNRIEIKSAGYSPLMAQVVATHYVDWADSLSKNANVNQSRTLRLDYKCDKQKVTVMQEINCSVEAERIGFQGYGMLLAEIGTPPGADVSRESLQQAMEADYSISRYDILPDRIVVYMWAKAGGAKFNFKFKPRYGINAQTPASTVYDYYNPEAKAVVGPLRFTAGSWNVGGGN